MRVRALLHCSVVAFTALIGTIPASAGGMTDFDVRKAETWADALAICDVTKFLLSEPNLDSEVIIAPVPGGAPVALHRPYFIPPSNFYSLVMRETFERVQKAGFVTPAAYADARVRYTKLMLSAYRTSTTDEAFLADQMRLCYAIAADTSGQSRAAKANASR